MNSEHSRPMTFEDEVDSALKMLGETQAPAELVSRVHRRLESQATLQGLPSSRRFLIPVAGVATAAMILVAIFAQAHRKSQNHAMTVETARAIATLPVAKVAIPAASGTSGIESSRTENRPLQLSGERRRHTGPRGRRANNLLSYPMTRQEKLLLQFAHNAKPADLQALNPEYQAKVEAQQDAEFAAYLKSGRSSNSDSSTQTTTSTQE